MNYRFFTIRFLRINRLYPYPTFDPEKSELIKSMALDRSKKGKRGAKKLSEEKRLLALHGYQILDTNEEEAYDQIMKFAAYLCKTPVSFINFVDDDRLWVKSGLGLDEKELLRNHSFCSYTIEGKDIFEVEDARKDDRFKHTPQVAKHNVVSYAGVPLIDSEGHALGTLCVIDTKPKKLTDKQKEGLKLFADQVSLLLKTQRSKIRYEALVESSRDMIYEIDAGGKFTFANKSTINRTGYSFDELKEMTCWDMVLEEERERVKKYHVDQIKAGNYSLYYEFPIVNKRGKTIWIGESVDFTFEKGRMTKARVIGKDISELIDTRIRLKETEEQILAEKTLLRTMVFSAPAAIAMFNKDLKYLAFSEQWMSNKTINERVIGLEGLEEGNVDQQSLGTICSRVLSGETISGDNDRVTDEEGNEYWLKWVATPWNNTTDGSIGGIIVYTDDVTNIIHHEVELEKAKEEAEASGKAKEEFLSSMSHEIRTPLNAIIGTTNLILEEKPELREDENFSLLKFSSNNLLSLINNVLDFSKIESGSIVIEKKDFDLKALINSLINSWKPVAIQKGIKLILKWDDSIQQIMKGDKVRLSQVFNNLINNALKFTDEGFVQLKISQTGVPNNLGFEIRDTGMGIPEEQRELIFESFRQAESMQNGTGLGLPICKKLLGMMGADLRLESKVGFGSVFSFELMLEEGQLAEPEEIDFTQRRLNQGLKLLLVEDNKANQVIIKSFLKKWNVSFELAENGKEAIEKIKDRSFDMVLMDMRMPIMDGYTATRHIRNMKDPYFRNVPIIALTASSLLDINKQSSVLHFDDYLSKPYDPSDLYNLLCRFSHEGNHVSKKIKTKSGDTKVKSEDLKDGVLSRLGEFTENDHDFLVEFTESIIGNMVLIENELPEFDKKDENQLRELAHKVDPTLQIIGASDLLGNLKLLAKCETKNEWNKITNKIDILMGEYNEVLESIVSNNETLELTKKLA